MRQPIKFYVDEHVATAVVKGLRQRGAEVLTVRKSAYTAQRMRNTWLGLRQMAVSSSLKTTISYVCMPQDSRTRESLTPLREPLSATSSAA